MEELYKKIAKAGIILLALALVVITFYTPIHDKILSRQFNKEMEVLKCKHPEIRIRGMRVDTIKLDTIKNVDY